MLNLRQLNKTDEIGTESDAQHFSRFSLEFRAPSNLLGNIGESLNHSQSEQLNDDDNGERNAAPEGPEVSEGTNPDISESAAGVSGAHWNEGDEARVGAAPHAPGCIGGVSASNTNFTGGVCTSLCLY